MEFVTDLFPSPAWKYDLSLLVTERRVASRDLRKPVVPVAVVVEELEHGRLRQIAAVHRLATTLVDEWSGVDCKHPLSQGIWNTKYGSAPVADAGETNVHED